MGIAFYLVAGTVIAGVYLQHLADKEVTTAVTLRTVVAIIFGWPYYLVRWVWSFTKGVLG